MAATLLTACESSPAGSVASVDMSAPPAPMRQLRIHGDSEDELVTEVGDRVFFAFDKATLSAQAETVLRRQAAYMAKYPQLTFVIEGHCDERGTREYNLALGARRAAAVRTYLIALGVAPTRLTTISYGAERPAVLGSTMSAWDQNRRAVTVTQ